MTVIHFKNIAGSLFTLEIDPDASVSTAKAMLRAAHPEMSNIRLIFKGRILQDNVLLSSLGMSPSDFIVTHAKAPTAPRAGPSAPPAPKLVQPPEAVPPPQPAESVRPPPLGAVEDQTAIAQLMEMGFMRTDCEAALRTARWNVARASEFLLSGHVPEADEMSDSDAAFQEMRNLLVSNPRALENVVRSYETMDPHGLGARYRQHPEELIAFVGLDPNAFDLAAVRGRWANPIYLPATPQQQDEIERMAAAKRRSPLDDFSPEERDAIQRLQAMGNFGLRQAIQVFLAADKNETLAATLLMAMD